MFEGFQGGPQLGNPWCQRVEIKKIPRNWGESLGIKGDPNKAPPIKPLYVPHCRDVLYCRDVLEGIQGALCRSPMLPRDTSPWGGGTPHRCSFSVWLPRFLHFFPAWPAQSFQVFLSISNKGIYTYVYIYALVKPYFIGFYSWFIRYISFRNIYSNDIFMYYTMFIYIYIFFFFYIYVYSVIPECIIRIYISTRYIRNKSGMKTYKIYY